MVTVVLLRAGRRMMEGRGKIRSSYLCALWPVRQSRRSATACGKRITREPEAVTYTSLTLTNQPSRSPVQSAQSIYLFNCER